MFNNRGDAKQRFSLRKLTVGVVSVLLGLTFLTYCGTNVRADTTNDGTNTKTEEVSANKANASDVEKTTENNSSAEQGKAQAAKSAANNQEKTANNSQVDVKKTDENAVNEQGKTGEQGNNNQTEEKNSLEDKETASVTEQKNNDQLKANKVDATDQNNNGGLDESVWGKLNVADWDTNTDNNLLNIIGYHGSNKVHIIVPNAADFAKAGKNDKNLQVAITADVVNSILRANNPKTFAFSKTNGDKVLATGDNWSDAFTATYNRANNNKPSGLDSNLQEFDGSNLDTSNVTNMMGMFNGDQLTNLSGVANWDVSKVINMNSMFAENHLQDISGLVDWKPVALTTVADMFDNDPEHNTKVAHHNQISDLTALANWKDYTAKITNFSNMFCGNKIKDLTPLKDWKFDHAVTISNMFADNKISDLSPIANWDVSHIQNLGGLFNNNQLKDLSPLANWNVGNGIDFNNMFSQNQIADLTPLANWNMHQAQDLHYMFFNNQISNLNGLKNWDMANVQNMNTMFGTNKISDDALKNLAGWNTAKVTDFAGMFSENKPLTDLEPLKNWQTGSAKDMSSMFEGDDSITNADLSKWDFSHVVENTGRSFGYWTPDGKITFMPDASGLANIIDPICQAVIYLGDNATLPNWALNDPTNNSIFSTNNGFHIIVTNNTYWLSNPNGAYNSLKFSDRSNTGVMNTRKTPVFINGTDYAKILDLAKKAAAAAVGSATGNSTYGLEEKGSLVNEDTEWHKLTKDGAFLEKIEVDPKTNLNDPIAVVNAFYIITYKAEKAQISYIDDTEKKTIKTDQDNGKGRWGDVITFTEDPADVIGQLKAKGYEVVSDNFKAGTKYKDGLKNNSFEVHLKHTTQTVEDHKTITETVHYVFTDGSKAANDAHTSVGFYRTGTKDNVTGKIVWNNDWKALNNDDSYKDIVSPTIPGYEPDQAVVKGHKVAVTDKDSVVTVTYTAISQPTNPNPTNPTNPTNPSQPTVAPVHPQTPPTAPTSPKQPTKPGQTSNVRPHAGKTPTKPGKSTNKGNKGNGKTRNVRPIAQNVNHRRNGVGPTYIRNTRPQPGEKPSYSGVSNKEALKATNKLLPHTGARNNSLVGAIGAAFAAIAGLFGLAGSRRRRRGY